MSTAWLPINNASVRLHLLFPVTRNVVGRSRLMAVIKSSHSDSGTMPCF